MGVKFFSENSIKAVNVRFKVMINYKLIKYTIILWVLFRIYICQENSDFPEVLKNKFAHGIDLNFYDKQKNFKAKI